MTCAICGRPFLRISVTHLRTHDVAMRDYQARFPGALLCNERIGRSLGVGASRRARYLAYDGREPDDRLFAFLTGSLLGDASLSRTGKGYRLARYTEGSKNEPYLAWKRDILADYFPVHTWRRVSRPHKVTGKRYTGYWLRTGAHPLLTEWRSQWYGERKIVPRALVEQYLTAFALAIWFCDDGCAHQYAMTIYTMAFSHEEVQWLADLLRRRFGLCFKVVFKRKEQPCLYLPARDKNQLQQLIAPFDIPGMEYKYRLKPNEVHWQVRPIEQLTSDGRTIIARFPSLTSAARTIGAPLSTLFGAVRCGSVSGGYRWRYAAIDQNEQAPEPRIITAP